MSEKYTLTLYIAPPGGKRVDDKGNPLPDSEPGHVYYAIQKTGGDKRAYGFSPAVEFSAEQLWRNKGISLPGHVVPDEHKTYANPAYMRTMEISKEQYEKLQAFGEASLQPDHARRVAELTQGKFSTEKYNVFDNSCVDYVFHALRYSGVYNHKIPKPSSEMNEFGERVFKMTEDDGEANVLFNARIFNQIPLKTVGNIYDRTEEEIKKAPMPYNLNVLNSPNDSINTPQFAQMGIEQRNQDFISQGFAGLLSDNPQQSINQLLNSNYAQTFDIQAKQVLAHDEAQKQQESAQVQELSTPRMVRS